MPGDQAGGVGLQNAAATFLPEHAAEQLGHKFHVGYNVAAAGADVCWYEYTPGHLELVVRNSQRHQIMTGPPLADWFGAYRAAVGNGQGSAYGSGPIRPRYWAPTRFELFLPRK